ncbi:MAG TPA: hypothetical protein VG675_05385 [Bryobacteraceae bacterium]|nr:hypothetical protein [Bryobacteraceae bacterium]
MYPEPPGPERQSFRAVLAAELARIRLWRENRGVEAAGETVATENSLDDADHMRLIGLAFSGGGIRSATFNLGVLQAMGALKLLRHMDYLSTVSGGGYIGVWLNAMVRRSKEGIAEVEAGLDPEQATSGALPQKAIAYLRTLSNYLTPKLSGLSADAWSMWSIWLRNTMLNLVVLVCGMAAVLLAASEFGLDTFASDNLGWCLCGCIAGLVLSTVFLALNLGDWLPRSFRRDKGVQLLVVAPALLFGVSLAGLICREPQYFDHSNLFRYAVIVLCLQFFILQLLAGFWRCFREQHPKLPFSFLWNAILQLSVAGAGGYATALMFRWLAHMFVTLQYRSDFAWILLTLAPAAVLAVLSVAVTLHVGLLGRDIPDSTREWIGRLGAWISIYGLIWLLLFGAAIYGPSSLRLLWGWLRMTITGAWIATTVGSLIAARSSDTSGKPMESDDDATEMDLSHRALEVLARVGPWVFIAGFVLAISLAVDELSMVFSIRELLAACLIIAVVMSWRVDINEFSLHHFYKNRLVRCYLGASRDRRARHPNPFTGFDPEDDLPLNSLDTADFSGPMPILNTTLNLSSGRNLAWQERKGASFIFTPVYSGYDTGRGDSGTSASRQMRVGERAGAQAYWPSRLVAEAVDGGIRLGTVMAISGAAANPNSGYHTSTSAAFLMTVFNVRLGWWLGNPAQSYASWSGPAFGLPYTIKELLGSTNAESRFVNLSDGGHFDNLGIYELVRRRCRYIIVCDAEQDEKLTFGGLATAVRMCRTDFGAEIEIDLDQIRRHGSYSQRHCAVGTIRYKEAPPNQIAYLVYLKASLTGDEPADVIGYHSRTPQFPHESTADQWFAESQFESYRRLGMHIADQVFRANGTLQAATKDEYFERLRQSYGVAHAADTVSAGKA